MEHEISVQMKKNLQGTDNVLKTFGSTTHEIKLTSSILLASQCILKNT